jgi:hypothetical protein
MPFRDVVGRKKEDASSGKKKAHEPCDDPSRYTSPLRLTRTDTSCCQVDTFIRAFYLSITALTCILSGNRRARVNPAPFTMKPKTASIGSPRKDRSGHLLALMSAERPSGDVESLNQIDTSN